MDEFTRRSLNHELRNFRRGWGLLVLVVGGLHFFGYMIARLGLGLVDDDIAAPLYFYFTGFHLWLFVAVPLIAWWQARCFRLEMLDQMRLTLIPERSVLTMVWARALIKPLALLLILYFSLWWVFPWLYEYGPPDFNVFPEIDWKSGFQLKILIFTLLQIGIVTMFLLPWTRIQSRRGKILHIFVAQIFLGSFLQIKSGSGDFNSFLALAHPSITLPYFILTLTVNSLFAVRIGLHPPMRLRGLTAVVAVLIPMAAEFATIALLYGVVVGGLSDLFDGWFFLYIMFSFYSIVPGAFWLGLKWNLTVWLLRRPLFRP